ncbi:pentapeptide repeat family protein [Geminocystis sp. NIES-3708]|uniref:pentapeptide repeat-containing protein n=1 Tax=Geminocystis sp. NIES-3708 TaxID=1615909 RepID=UPI0005FC6203|nr:pentapeptide repeat-containing protein [Geminocystis sp. NIES-3708]BAQ61759.1 pentapeptide repeat family protein [Geminocystis sp. NIES-3708]
MQLLESHNQCPDCVLMELQILPKANTDNQFELYLNLQYNQQQEEVLEGKVKFSLRSSKLSLSLNNLKFIENISLNSPLISVTNNAFSKQPTWEIRHHSQKKFLEDKLINIQLGILEIQSYPYQLTAQLLAKKADVFLTDIEGLWFHDISPNKHAILERKLAEFIENTQLKPYISQAIFGSENLDFTPNLFHEQQANLRKEQSIVLKKIIQIIYQNNKNSFTELAEIASLNPLTDFAGGDLTAANLSGLNLSGSNFTSANLRGADLTDTDLSEANLQYIKLNGADLSGAYLDGTNLQNASLQNASLALANVIGANLNNANLTNTNLQNTSLGKTNVKGTIFSKNLGLDEDKKQDLIKEGAIFIE